MTILKLAKLPDRTPVKISVLLTPELRERLGQYAALYGEIYGQKATISELIPAMVAAFLDSDRGFIKAHSGGR